MKIKKKVLIHSIVFSPDSVSTAYLYNDIAIGLLENGFNVVVLTTMPHYNSIDSELKKQPIKMNFFGLYGTSNFNGIKVYHVPIKKYKSVSLRLISFLYWHFFSFILGININNLSYVISPSPPLSIGFISHLIAKIKKAKSIYNVQEIYPDLLINQGNLKSKLIISLLKNFEKLVYNCSDAVVTIDNGFYSKIKSRFKAPEKLHVIPNFVDINLYKPMSSNLKFPKIIDNRNNKIKLVYAGNIGYYQDWEPVLFAAEKLLYENIEFWIIGEGVRKENLVEAVKTKGLSNVKIFPYQNRADMPTINNLADIHFIVTNKKMDQEGFPSKVYAIMATAKPLIAVCSLESPLYNFLSDKHCSILISKERNQQFVKSIRKLARDKELRNQLGRNGYNHIIDNYSKEKVISKYVNLLNSI